MLRQRVVTALVLFLVVLASLSVASAWPFALLTLVLIAAGAWEWLRLNGLGQAAAVGLALLLALVCAAALATGFSTRVPAALWWAALALWAVGGFIGLRAGPAAWPRLPRAARCGLGLLALAAAWLALAQARVLGINFLLSLLCLVWMADIGAYFGGRAFGRRKLAPAISPGKSWEGVWSGLAGVALLAALWTAFDVRFGADGPSLYARLADGGGLALALGLPLLVALSVVGDLLESLVKRAAGAKDSSRLLPGHGGVLDRVDALLPVLPAALALLTLA